MAIALEWKVRKTCKVISLTKTEMKLMWHHLLLI